MHQNTSALDAPAQVAETRNDQSQERIKTLKDTTLNKFLNKWFRKFHRWLVLPFITLLLIVIFMRGTVLGDSAQRIQAIFMIIMAISGTYLWLLPYWTKRKRKTVQTRS